jgi:hypothetical protein
MSGVQSCKIASQSTAQLLQQEQYDFAQQSSTKYAEDFSCTQAPSERTKLISCDPDKNKQQNMLYNKIHRTHQYTLL